MNRRISHVFVIITAGFFACSCIVDEEPYRFNDEQFETQSNNRSTEVRANEPLDTSEFTPSPKEGNGDVTEPPTESSPGEEAVPQRVGGGDDVACDDDFACDDGIACTRDECTADGCTNTPNHDQCTDSADGLCSLDAGCQYPACNRSNCIAGGCETAVCDGDTCVRISTCQATESCCAGSCVPAQCSDGVECTTDSCDPTLGCVHEPTNAKCTSDNECQAGRCDAVSGCVLEDREGACDDGVFCNGTDTCQTGACSVHAGNRCPGDSECSEREATCTGCATDADCQEPEVSQWSECAGFDGVCGTTGSEARTVTTYSCSAGNCEPSEKQETRECTRKTDGDVCRDVELGRLGTCDFGGSECAEDGTRTQTRTAYTCQAGRCNATTTELEMECSRSTSGDRCDDGDFCNGLDECNRGACSNHDGDPCAGESQCNAGKKVCEGCATDSDCPRDEVSDWDDCGGFDGICGTAGTRTRTITEYSCSRGVCNESERVQTGSCSRTIPGSFECAEDEESDVQACVSTGDSCSLSGQQLYTLTEWRCSAGSCRANPSTEMRTCTRSTQNDSCDDGLFCNGSDSCAGGSCRSGGDPCRSRGQLCDEDNNSCVDCFRNSDCSDDGLFCNGSEFCNSRECESRGNPCSAQGQFCDEAGDRCVECLNQSHCSGGEFCQGNRCVECRNASDCDDNNSCTEDSCSSGSCKHEDGNNGAVCECGGDDDLCLCGGGECTLVDSRRFELEHFRDKNTEGIAVVRCLETKEECKVNKGICSIRCPTSSEIFTCCSGDSSCDDGKDGFNSQTVQGPFPGEACEGETTSEDSGRIGFRTCAPSMFDGWVSCIDEDAI